MKTNSKLMNPYAPSLHHDSSETGNISFAVASGVRLLTAFVTLVVALGFIGGFRNIAESAASDPWGIAIGCVVISVLALVTTKLYVLCRPWKKLPLRLTTLGIFAETACFTSLLIVLLGELASLPGRILGYRLEEMFSWYNDFYVIPLAAPLAGIATVELTRHFRVFARSVDNHVANRTDR
ncbi:hypothetical protein [Novipirellula artificiosorum]|uniref:Uncharacterized protein n=1 Tax=Novipirellula artificiosorum TaxID=2528016 RepID=A0A5C6DR15_9BACT|nr:hypothetical protein [Novipirellula artificiosorum]TWU37446.1 hypothetical protein Poly41_35780 [Novipirellula artificiosorum]